MIAEERKLFKWRGSLKPGEEPALDHVVEWIAREITLTLEVNGQELVSFSSSPVHCMDLAVGFLFTESIIRSSADVRQSEHDEKNDRIAFILNPELNYNPDDWTKRRTLTSGCAQGVVLGEILENLPEPVQTELRIDPSYIGRMFSNLKLFSFWHEKTGCLHHAVLAPQGRPAVIREDIGRHNCVDKVIGAGLSMGVDFSTCVLSCSGRLSSEMLYKAGRAGIPFVVSRAAPTALAVSLAEKMGITMIGFARGKRLNVYAHPERINFDNTVRHRPLSAVSSSFNRTRD